MRPDRVVPRTDPVFVRPGDLDDPRVLELLRLHLSALAALTPAENFHALDVSGLRGPGLDLWTAWVGGAVVGCAALKHLGPVSAEIKSMRTHPDHLRRGVATCLLQHLLGIARDRGYRTLSLETGVGPAFEPALATYRRHGFAPGPAFGGYRPSAFNQFLHLHLPGSST